MAGRGAKPKKKRKAKGGGGRTYAVAAAQARVRDATAMLVRESARALERARLAPSEEGQREHFLRRLTRLSDEARAVATRLYYDTSMARFVARVLLGLDPVLVGFETDPEGSDELRLVIDLEAGSTPSRLVMTSRGCMVTCLAADMAVGGGVRVPFAALSAALERHAEWLAMQASAREIAERVDLAALQRRAGRLGWLVPREDAGTLAALGPAAGTWLLTTLSESGKGYARAADAAAFAHGARTDAELLAWHRASGELSVLLLLLARCFVAPNPQVLRTLLIVCDPMLALTIGATVAVHWPVRGIGVFLRQGSDPEGLVPDLLSVQWAVLGYNGVARRMLGHAEGPASCDAGPGSATD